MLCQFSGDDMASFALKQANSRLLRRRAQLKASRGTGVHRVSDSAPIAESLPEMQEQSHDLTNAQKTLAAYRRRDGVDLPLPPAPKASPKHTQLNSTCLTNVSPAATLSQNALPLHDSTVRHYPTLGVAALEAEQVPHYRVWLLCHHLDMAGRGWLEVDHVRQLLTGQDSVMRVCGWRRLRQILGSGHDRFWKWDKQNGRLWLFGAVRVAAGLAVSRLSGLPVALPVSVAAAAIGEFKAHLYGAWHSGRRKSNPITRREQETTTGVPERTQRAYCKTANVVCKRNIAIGESSTEEAFKKNAWRYGQVFEFVDHHGQHGQVGRAYIAWQMPNSYTGTHQKTAKGRMRKINRKLKDLVTLGAQGNSGGNVDKLYYANGGEAGRAFNRNADKDAYWPLHVSGQRRQADLWSVFFVE